MGIAKKRRMREDEEKKHTRIMKRARFNLFTMGTRLSRTAYMCKEVSWWSSHDETLIGMVALDTTDNDYFWMILARDRIGRFRCARIEANFNTQSYAETKLRIAMAEVLRSEDIAEFGRQGDETNNPIDPFQLPTDYKPEKIHPYFDMLLNEPGRAPARAVLRELALWLAPTDPHLVTEFQTNGFDQRLWEFYLWAAFREFSLDVKQLEAPDFHCTAPGIDFTVEATTVAPSLSGALADHPNPKTLEEREEFLRNYMPMKFGSALINKLNKRNAKGQKYWERDESLSKPFIIAIADFHKAAEGADLGPMTYTQSALYQYLYGSRVCWRFEDDKLIIEPEKIDSHQFKEKSVPSGFFDLEDAENVSAILFSNAGTIAKFDRMGVAAGFGADGYEYYRIGFKYNPDQNAVFGEPFTRNVRSEIYEEWWTQEIQVFHNPNAKFPLEFDALPGATHHYFENGYLRSMTPSDAVLGSFTMLVRNKNEDAEEGAS